MLNKQECDWSLHVPVLPEGHGLVRTYITVVVTLQNK